MRSSFNTSIIVLLLECLTRVSVKENNFENYDYQNVREALEVRPDKREPGWTLFEHEIASISINQHESLEWLFLFKWLRVILVTSTESMDWVKIQKVGGIICNSSQLMMVMMMMMTMWLPLLSPALSSISRWCDQP